MPATTPYAIGMDVTCTDGDCGKLSRVIVDPVAKELAYLVVEPGHSPDLARLVPVELVDTGDETFTDGRIRLQCDHARFEQLEYAHETEFITADRDQLGYPPHHMMWMPYVPLGYGGIGGGMATAALGPVDNGPEAQTVSYDRLPSGDVQIRRGEPVHATDGDIGQVQGLVVDPSDRGITHVLLREGHLWGKKQVAIPITAVTDAHDGVRLNLSKEQVKDLPAVDLGDYA